MGREDRILSRGCTVSTSSSNVSSLSHSRSSSPDRHRRRRERDRNHSRHRSHHRSSSHHKCKNRTSSHRHLSRRDSKGNTDNDVSSDDEKHLDRKEQKRRRSHHERSKKKEHSKSKKRSDDKNKEEDKRHKKDEKRNKNKEKQQRHTSSNSSDGSRTSSNSSSGYFSEDDGKNNKKEINKKKSNITPTPTPLTTIVAGTKKINETHDKAKKNSKKELPLSTIKTEDCSTGTEMHAPSSSAVKAVRRVNIDSLLEGGDLAAVFITETKTAKPTTTTSNFIKEDGKINNKKKEEKKKDKSCEKNTLSTLEEIEAKEKQIKQYESKKIIEEQLQEQAWRSKLKTEKQRLKKEGYFDNLNIEIELALESENAVVSNGVHAVSKVSAANKNLNDIIHAPYTPISVVVLPTSSVDTKIAQLFNIEEDIILTGARDEVMDFAVNLEDDKYMRTKKNNNGDGIKIESSGSDNDMDLDAENEETDFANLLTFVKSKSAANVNKVNEILRNDLDREDKKTAGEGNNSNSKHYHTNNGLTTVFDTIDDMFIFDDINGINKDKMNNSNHQGAGSYDGNVSSGALVLVENVRQKAGSVFAEDINCELDKNVLDKKKGTLQMSFSSAEKEKIKMMTYVNHSKIQYEPFKKDFYIPPKDTSCLTEVEIQQLYKELDGAHVTGNNVPKPIKTWVGIGLKEEVMKLLQEKGFLNPFSVQSLAIPILMSGRNLLITAKTGSGKTLAYVLPLIRHVVNQSRCGKHEGPIGLILVPTQELGQQVYLMSEEFCAVSGLRIAASFGGVPLQKNIAACVSGCDIMIATPGRLLDLCVKKKVVKFNRCTLVVIDEADRMFDSGFKDHVNAFLKNIRPDRQVALISATLPKEMRSTAKAFLSKDPLVLKVGGRPSPSTNVEQHIEFFDQQNYDAEGFSENSFLARDPRYLKLLQILGDELIFSQHRREEWKRRDIGGTGNQDSWDPSLQEWNTAIKQVLIFVRDKEMADMLYLQLLKDGYKDSSGNSIVGVFYSGMSQLDRQASITQFTPNDRPILVATGVAERGMDFINLDLVINYDMPDHYESYVHRIGRTGRAGKRGRAISFFLRIVDDPMAADLVEGLSLSGQSIPEELYQHVQILEERIKSGEYVPKNYSKGFGFGKGYTFSSAEEKHKMKQDLAAMGLDEDMSSDSDDENATAKKDVDDDEGIFWTDKNGGEPEITEITDEETAGTTASGDGRTSGITSTGGYAGADFFSCSGVGQSSAALILYKGGQLAVSGQQHNAIEAARRFAENFTAMHAAENRGIGTVSGVLGGGGQLPRQRMYEAKYPVNDRPEYVRRAIMRSEFIHTVEANTRTTITKKGRYIDPRMKKRVKFENNKNKIKKEEQELYLEIRGNTREDITRVFQAFEKCIQEATNRAASRQSSSGKKIVF